MAWDDTSGGLCNQPDDEGADANTPMRSTLDPQRLPYHTSTPEPGTVSEFLLNRFPISVT